MFRIIAIAHAIFAVAYAYEDGPHVYSDGTHLWNVLFGDNKVCCPLDRKKIWKFGQKLIRQRLAYLKTF